jgi:hypothetical protein
MPNCTQCGIEFRKTTGKQVTCGPACSRLHRRKFERTRRREIKARQPPKTTSCAVCGKEFRRASGCKHTCSQECWRVKNRRDKLADYHRTKGAVREKPVIAPFPVDIDKDAFGDFLPGFVDAEGSFQLAIRETGKGTRGVHCRAIFSIALRDDDADLLRMIQSYFGEGSISSQDKREDPAVPNRKPQVKLVIQDLTALATKVIPFFDEHPLRAKKRRDYEIWREGVLLLAEVAGRPNYDRKDATGAFISKWEDHEFDRFCALSNALKELREYSGSTFEGGPRLATCIICNVEFVKSGNRKTCSPECGRRNVLNRDNAWKRKSRHGEILPVPEKLTIPELPTDIDRPKMGRWLSGFSDGEASFQLVIGKGQKGKLVYRALFDIQLRNDDIDSLRLIQSYFGEGDVKEYANKRSNNAKPVAWFSIKKTMSLLKVIAHFDEHPMWGKKRHDFEIWKEGVLLLAEIKGRERIPRPALAGFFPKMTEMDRERFRSLSDALKERRKYRPLV